MVRPRRTTPVGLRGPIGQRADLLGHPETCVRLPAIDLGRLSLEDLARDLHGRNGADEILIDGWRQHFGPFRERLPELLSSLSDTGALILDLLAPGGVAAVHTALDGQSRSHAFWPETAVPLSEALSALETCGLHVDEVVRCGHLERWTRAQSKALGEISDTAGAIHMDPAPGRLWIRARKGVCRQTPLELALAAESRDQLAAIDSAWADSAAEQLLLRPASLPESTRLPAYDAADAGIDAWVTDSPGGAVLVALRCDRLSWLRVGPFQRQECDPEVALDDWLLRAEALDLPIRERRVEAAPALLPQPSPEALQGLLIQWGQSEPKRDTSGSPARLSACLIVRNEERFLPDCLASLEGIADEIVVVDTGSTDRTVQIAEEAGARVLHEPWNTDFAAARNVALRAASGDWVLQIDADERLRLENPTLLRTLLNDPEVGVAHLLLQDVDEEGAPKGSPTWLTRLFRRFDGLAYVGRIHEQIWPTLGPEVEDRDLRAVQLPIQIEHLGYQEAVYEDRDKTARNRRLFGLAVADRPEDPYLGFLYSDFLATHGDTAFATSIRNRVVDQLRALPPGELARLPFASTAAAGTIDALRGAGEIERAMDLADHFGRHARPSTHLMASLAELALATDRPLSAIGFVEVLRELTAKPAFLPTARALSELVPEVLHARALHALGRLEEANAVLRRVRDRTHSETPQSSIAASTEPSRASMS